ncbi:vascular endothelial growth factor C-like [Gadus chalcogrammus]|uniref:vascular endothelial growth factor C-like n=1 Tax=Gadus chalcogrammus TaxID=1042646 RepID=UPI0024C455AC|nr:vascular endothelial growth factor C-like [Gadus chalcogrammus]
MLKLVLLLWLVTRTLTSGPDFYDYFQSGDMGTESPGGGGGGGRGLDSVSNLDELLQLLHPEASRLQLCLRRRSQTPTSLLLHPAGGAQEEEQVEEALWGNPRQEALRRADGVFEVVLEELQRTACRPREVCVEVSKEAPEPSSRQYLPRCVALHRCGGCCHHEGVACTNTSHHLVNKTVLELSPLMERLVVTVTFVNHTSCECVSKRPLRTVIRRHAPPLCPPPQAPCSPGLFWDAEGCECAPDDGSHPVRDLGAFATGPLALCGPRRALDDASCECVCRNGLTDSSCEPGWRLDHDTCECQCEEQVEGRGCPSGQRWEAELCGCVCAARCPGDQPLNPDTCLCQCRESPQSCLRQGKRFNTHTCSCYRLPCRKSKRGCPRGFYYSSQVCQCIPTYMRPAWN